MLGYLKDVFPTILIYLLSITVILNILEYIRVLVKFFLSSQIYKQLFDYLNLTYIVSLIRKIRLKDLDFLIPSGNAVSKISKIIIIMNKINNAIQMIKHLWLKLFKYI